MSQSEIARLREQIDREYQAAQWALTGMAYGTARHDFINAKQERIAQCHDALNELVGPQAATVIVAETLSQSTQPVQSTQPGSAHTDSKQNGITPGGQRDIHEKLRERHTLARNRYETVSNEEMWTK